MTDRGYVVKAADTGAGKVSLLQEDPLRIECGAKIWGDCANDAYVDAESGVPTVLPRDECGEVYSWTRRTTNSCSREALSS